MSEVEYKLTELAQLKSDSEIHSEYKEYLTKNLSAVSKELLRRKNLEKLGAPRIVDRGRYSPQLINEIKNRIPLSKLMGYDIYIDPVPSGNRRLKAHCPIHGDGQDSNASMTIFETEGRYWCFGCGGGGDHIDWMMSYKHMGFTESVEYLANMVGLDLKTDVPSRNKKPPYDNRGFE